MNCQTKCPAIRVVMFPKDTNPSGNIFGGVILSNIDIAAGVAARAVTLHRTVTVLMKEVQFRLPVKVGDILTFWADVVRTGRTSVTIRVRVEADRRGEIIPVTEGEAIFVAVDEKDRPIPLDSPPGTQGGDDSTTGSASSPAASSTKRESNGSGAHNCDHASPVVDAEPSTKKKDKKEKKKNKKKKNKKKK
jgi:acyl-CoA thioesterase YciA